jgi:hypothetical protein
VAVLASAARDAGGFDASLRACEDWDLWLRLRAAGDFVAVPGALAFYRAHAGSLTEDVETMERERLRMNEKHHGAAQGDPARWPLDRRRAVGHTLFVSGLAHLRRREDERGRQKIRRAIEVWPGLIDEDELYYELACARQPRGRKGASSDLDLGESARLIEWVLPDGGGRSLPVRARLAIGNLALLGGGRRAARLHALAALGGGGGSRRRAALELLAAASLPAAVSGRLRAWRAGRQERAAEESAGPVSGVPA